MKEEIETIQKGWLLQKNFTPEKMAIRFKIKFYNQRDSLNLLKNDAKEKILFKINNCIGSY